MSTSRPAADADQNGSGDEHEHSDGHGDGESGIRGMSMSDAELDSAISTPPVLNRFLSTVELGAVQRIVDLGCGPGVAAIAFAKRFPDASVIGLDLNPEPLAVAATRATEAGLEERVRFAEADFNEDLTANAERADLVWASMSLHHTPDPALALGRACAILADGGRIAVAEFGKPVTIWPDTAPVVTSGVWDRWQAAWARGLEDHLGPAATNVDWPALLEANDLVDLQQFECEIHFPAPLGDRYRQWMTTHLERGLHFNEGRVSAEDLAAIEALIDADNPDGIAHSADAFVHSTRMIYTAVRTTA